MPIVQLQKFLGHSDLKQTQRYIHPLAEHIADAIQNVNFDQLIDLDRHGEEDEEGGNAETDNSNGPN